MLLSYGCLKQFEYIDLPKPVNMSIPANITREHVIKAIARVRQEGVPPYRGIRTWELLFEGEIFPPKLLISWANKYANGIELNPNPNNFQADMAVQYLTNLGFKIRRLKPRP